MRHFCEKLINLLRDEGVSKADDFSYYRIETDNFNLFLTNTDKLFVIEKTTSISCDIELYEDEASELKKVIELVNFKSRDYIISKINKS